MDRGTPVTTVDELEALIGTPEPRTANKARAVLHAVDRQWLAASPLLFIATSDASGALDVSPKGDPAGFVRVLDDRTIAIPERPGNRRADGFHNLLGNPHVGVISVIPGRGDTLRINGRARLLADAPYADQMIVKGHKPVVILEVDVEQIFFHCSKAFLRSNLWKPETWQPDAVPSRAVIAKSLERPDDSMEELEAYYGSASYEKQLYTPS